MTLAAVPALGAHLVRLNGADGVRFAVWAPEATALEVQLFDGDRQPTGLVALEPQGDGLWSRFVPGLTAGQAYGLRAHGPWNPAAGQRFNPARLLIDPWALGLSGDTARLALQVGHAVADPLKPDQHWAQHRPEPADNAGAMPLSLVVDAAAELAAGAAIAPRPSIAPDRVVLYEAHVKALTRLHPAVPPAQRGTYAGLAHPAVLAHLQRLGVTTVCLLPVHTHISERHLLARGLVNHWGYNTLSAFAPDAGYAACTAGRDPVDAAEAQAVRGEFRAMVDALHRAGIEVVLDVVFNHTAESDLDGPTLSWRGLGQNHWYAMAEHGVPHNFSGCGNSLNVSEPRVVQWVTDSLRWWVQAYGVDGFRFDLAVSLGRVAAQEHGFDRHAPLLTAMRQDPVLRDVRLIAEPWDIGPDGHRTGGFAPGWLEWNDAFRDGVRAFWLGHPATRSELATRVCGSGDKFRHSARSPLAGVNLLTAHDGFNLADLTAYTQKHNEANGENNRDGHGHNLGANGGAEGPSNDPAVLHRRGLWRRALLATLFCAKGTPQLLAGDEIGHSQRGNNNAYCQDNALTWLDWVQADGALTAFVAGLTSLRRRHPGLRHARWFDGPAPAPGQVPDIVWSDLDGSPLPDHAWHDPAHRSLVARTVVGESGEVATEELLMVWHTGGRCTLRLPAGQWTLRLDSSTALIAGLDQPGQQGVQGAQGQWLEGQLPLDAPTVCVLVRALHGPNDHS
ncbi:glycogen debranching protein GlgX [Hydrogenophaga sp. RWCD_12]|uniref:glycogen debranching protein GlgX n=1 Tax=Hydrogenophaga sp. RWCD_12 TaxID=3391190 RepID=UPI003984D017